MSNFLVFDVEAMGLHGVGFAMRRAGHRDLDAPTRWGFAGWWS